MTRNKDLPALVALLAALILPGLRAVSSPSPPAEDAAILMRYIQHVAGGHGMVWNLGEPPVDGATDMLFTLLAAGLVRCGVALEAAVRGLAAGAHVLTVFAVYLGIRRLHRSPIPLALFCAVFLAWGPGFRYVELYFATPIFALLAAVAWILAYSLRERPESPSLCLLFAATSLLASLDRPEGVFLTAFMLAAVIFWVGLRRSLRPVAAFAAVFGLLGGAFFLARWRYFGHLLPTPFYKKGGGALHWGSLRASVEAVARLCLPFLLTAPLALRSRQALRRLAFALFPIGGFTLLWVLLSNEMNILHRFQFALVPIVLLSVPDWMAGLGSDLGLPPLASLPSRGRWTVRAALAVATVAVLAFQVAVYRPRPWVRDGRYDAARLLAAYRGRGYTVVTSEAGLVPLYSRWRAVDAWGLNDLEIARQGLSQERLARERPEIILFHANLSPMVAGPLGQDGWSRMVNTLLAYARRHGYVVAAVYGHNPFDTHSYLVRPGFPDSRAIIAGLRAIDYRWPDEGDPSVNFALWQPVRSIP